MKKVFLMMVLLMASSSVMALNQWSQMVCRGTDTAGYPITLVANSDSSYVNINGDLLRIVGRTNNGQGIVTEDFVATNGMVVYDSIVPVTNVNVDIYQFNSVTQVLLAKARLYCNFRISKGGEANVMNQKIFALIHASKNQLKAKNTGIAGFARDLSYTAK